MASGMFLCVLSAIDVIRAVAGLATALIEQTSATAVMYFGSAA